MTYAKRPRNDPPTTPKRPRKEAPATPQQPCNEPTSAEAYLRSVVDGTEPPNAVRVRAALGLIKFERPVTRAPLPSPPPKQLAAHAARDAQAALADDFQARAAAIRAKHATARKKPAA